MEATSPVPSYVGSPGPDVGNEEEEETKQSVLKKFIDVYRSMPELWNTSTKEYSDRDKKRKGYEILRQIYLQLKPKATIEDVKKQINTLRSNCRKELKKIKDSKRTGSGSESVYEPSAWTFSELEFSSDVEIPDKGRSSIIKQNKATEDTQREDTIDIVTNNPKKIKYTEKQEKHGQKQLLSLACQYLSKEEEYPIATVWGKKLKELDPQQAIFAEKAINDILFEAQLGTLTRNSIKINCDGRDCRPPSSMTVFSRPASLSLPSSSSDDSCSRPTSAQSSSFGGYNTNYRYVSIPMFSPPIPTQVHNQSEQNVPLNNEQHALQVNQRPQLPADLIPSGIKDYFATFESS